MCEVLPAGPAPCNPPHGVCDYGATNGSSSQPSPPSCTCLSTSYYISQGDFRFQAGLSCDVFVPAIMGLWGVNLALALLCIMLAAFHGHLAMKKFLDRRRMQRRRRDQGGGMPYAAPAEGGGRRAGKNKADARPIIFGLVIVCEMFYGAEAVLKLADPAAHTIGMHPATTWCYCLGTAVLWCFGFVFFDLFLDITMLNSRRFGRNVNKVRAARVRRALPMIWLVLMVGNVVSSVVPLYMPASMGDTVVRVGYYILATGVLCVAVVVYVAINYDVGVE